MSVYVCHIYFENRRKIFQQFMFYQKDVGSSPALNQNFLIAGYFGLVRLIFANSFKGLQRAPFNFFLFCKRIDVQKLPKPPFFYIFRHYATYRRPKQVRKKNFPKIFFNFFLMRVLLKRMLDTL